MEKLLLGQSHPYRSLHVFTGEKQVSLASALHEDPTNMQLRRVPKDLGGKRPAQRARFSEGLKEEDGRLLVHYTQEAWHAAEDVIKGTSEEAISSYLEQFSPHDRLFELKVYAESIAKKAAVAWGTAARRNSSKQFLQFEEHVAVGSRDMTAARTPETIMQSGLTTDLFTLIDLYALIPHLVAREYHRSVTEQDLQEITVLPLALALAKGHRERTMPFLYALRHLKRIDPPTGIVAATTFDKNYFDIAEIVHPETQAVTAKALVIPQHVIDTLIVSDDGKQQRTVTQIPLSSVTTSCPALYNQAIIESNQWVFSLLSKHYFPQVIQEQQKQNPL